MVLTRFDPLAFEIWPEPTTFLLVGTVYSGKCRGLPVAIKKLKVEALDPETLEDFRKEVSVLRYAVCT
jgi:hypothetical protein